MKNPNYPESQDLKKVTRLLGQEIFMEKENKMDSSY